MTEGVGELERYVLVLGDELVMGRTDGAIKVPSNAVSREHLRITRDGDAVLVRDSEAATAHSFAESTSLARCRSATGSS